VTAFIKAVWDRGGEGAVLKRLDSKYYAGQRAGQRGVPACWIKIKREFHDTLTVVGFEPSRGTVRFPGHPFAIAKLRDAKGNETTCKVVNDKELAKLGIEFNRRYPIRTERVLTLAQRVAEQSKLAGFKWPFEGRKLVIEHYGRTNKGGYRGPVRWDRWEDE
jgi:ATP-dependent DNA ligase